MPNGNYCFTVMPCAAVTRSRPRHRRLAWLMLLLEQRQLPRLIFKALASSVLQTQQII